MMETRGKEKPKENILWNHPYYNFTFSFPQLSFPGGAHGKEPTCQFRSRKRCKFSPWFGKIPWRRKWQLTAVFLPGKSHGQRSLVGYSPSQRLGQDWVTEPTYIPPLIIEVGCSCAQIFPLESRPPRISDGMSICHQILKVGKHA